MSRTVDCTLSDGVGNCDGAFVVRVFTAFRAYMCVVLFGQIEWYMHVLLSRVDMMQMPGRSSLTSPVMSDTQTRISLLSYLQRRATSPCGGVLKFGIVSWLWQGTQTLENLSWTALTTRLQ